MGIPPDRASKLPVGRQSDESTRLKIINAELRHPIGVDGGVRAPVNSKLEREFENWTTAVKTVCGRLNDADANLINGPQIVTAKVLTVFQIGLQYFDNDGSSHEGVLL